MRAIALGSILNQRVNLPFGDFFPATEEKEFDQKRHGGHVRAAAFHKLRRRLRGTARGQDVVHDQNLVAGAQSVQMHFQYVGAVFQLIRRGPRPVGKFPLFPDGDESRTQGGRYRAAENEAARFNGNDFIDGANAEGFNQLRDGLVEGLSVGQQGSDVFKDDPLFGKVGNIPNEAFEI